jgi:hypothetical protein
MDTAVKKIIIQNNLTKNTFLALFHSFKMVFFILGQVQEQA